MGIQSTQDITRKTAIERIKDVDKCIKEKDYRRLEAISSEHDHALIRKFIDNPPDCYNSIIDKYTNQMLEDIIDLPFYRFSLFDNYSVMDKEDD
jgi:hypothetical protein